MRTITCDVCQCVIRAGNVSIEVADATSVIVQDLKAGYSHRRIDMCRKCYEAYAEKTSGILEQMRNERKELNNGSNE